MRALGFLAATVALVAGCTPAYTVPSNPANVGVFSVTSGGVPITSVALIVGTNGTSTITVTESGYAGNFTATSSNSSVFTVAAPATALKKRDQSGESATSSGTFMLTAVGGGTATLNISDAAGHSTDIPVGVTETSGVVYSR
jgi:hypothetical protein